MKRIPSWIRYLAITGNVVYALWVVRNGIDEGFQAGLVEKASMVGLVLLLVLNVVVLLMMGRRDAAAA